MPQCYSKEYLENYPRYQLESIAKTWKIKGVTRKRKPQLMELICDHPNNKDLNNFINPVTIMKPKWLESVQNKQSKFRKEQRKIKRESKIQCEKQKEDYKENNSDSSAESRKEKKGTKRKREKVKKSDTTSHEKNHNARTNQANRLKNDDICTVCRQSELDAFMQPCRHEFHWDCALQALHRDSSCPNCRTQVDWLRDLYSIKAKRITFKRQIPEEDPIIFETSIDSHAVEHTCSDCGMNGDEVSMDACAFCETFLHDNCGYFSKHLGKLCARCLEGSGGSDSEPEESPPVKRRRLNS